MQELLQLHESIVTYGWFVLLCAVAVFVLSIAFNVVWNTIRGSWTYSGYRR